MVGLLRRKLLLVFFGDRPDSLDQFPMTFSLGRFCLGFTVAARFAPPLEENQQRCGFVAPAMSRNRR